MLTRFGWRKRRDALKAKVRKPEAAKPRRLRLESLEQRALMAVNIFVSDDGLVTLVDGNGWDEGEALAITGITVTETVDIPPSSNDITSGSPAISYKYVFTDTSSSN